VAKAACLKVEMDFLEREVEHRRLVMQKELAKAKAEEEPMCKREEEERQQDFPRHEVQKPDFRRQTQAITRTRT